MHFRKTPVAACGDESKVLFDMIKILPANCQEKAALERLLSLNAGFLQKTECLYLKRDNEY